MPGVRNGCVARGYLTTTTGTALYTVPEAHVLLLKDVRLWASAANTTTVHLYLNAPGVVLIDIGDVTLGPAAATGYSGWLALNAGDQVYAQQTAAVNVAYWISGALLPSVA